MEADKATVDAAPEEELATSNTPKISFSIEGVAQFISSYAESNTRTLTSVQSIILKRKVSIDQEGQIIFEIVNSLEAEEIETIKQKLIPAIKSQFEVEQLSISYVLNNDQKPDANRLYTASDKLNYLMDKKPLLKKLKDELGLDPDF
jgi:DNA polymerase III subunit gamma/tau